MRTQKWMTFGHGLLMAYVLGVGACMGEAPEDPADVAANALAKPKPPAPDGPGTGAATCAPILQENCNAKPLTAAQLKACEQDKRNRYNECLRVEDCTAKFEAALNACGDKPAETSPKRPAFDTCVQKASDALNTCIGSTGGPGTL